MRQTLANAAVSAACALMPVRADADWEYTRWGMMPGQVVAASKGDVHAIPPQRRGSVGIVTEAEGVFKTGTLVLFVSFGFRGPGGGLCLVSYVTQTAAQNYALRDYLVHQYGPPQPSGDEDLGSGVWHKPGADHIDLSLSDEGPAFVVQEPGRS